VVQTYGVENSLDEALSRVGDRWTLALVDALRYGPLRFGELLAAVPGIAPNILTRRLRQMVADGLVLAEPYSVRPPRVRYELSEVGRGLLPAMSALAIWGAENFGGSLPRHDRCGAELVAQTWCATCEEAVDSAHQASDIEM
jgi:DNA-binding HxlR family transcriptional regulator